MCKKISAIIVLIITVTTLAFPQYSFANTSIKPVLKADLAHTTLENGFIRKETAQLDSPSFVLLKNNSIVAYSNPITEKRQKSANQSFKQHKSRFEVIVTAYSSTVDQCDSTPFITASNTHVHDGTIACNFLPFGTKVIFPKAFGDKVFTVEDRMRDSWKIDIWFPSRPEALQFGKKTLEAVVVE